MEWATLEKVRALVAEGAAGRREIGAEYTTEAARGAFEWAGKEYGDYIERATLEHATIALLKGRGDLATRYLTQSIGEAVAGNNGD